MKPHICTLILFIFIALLTGCATPQDIRKCPASTLPTTCPDVPSQAYKKKKFINSIGMEFSFIPPGCFVMGADYVESFKFNHAVNITRGFWMQTTEVTQEQWTRIMGSNPSNFRGKNRPVEKVSWNDVQEYIEKLNTKEKGAYRLPTEAEWEYACRGGKSGEKYCGGKDVDTVAWYKANSNKETQQVAGKRPNGYGLYDMSGNAWEWVSDWYDWCYYSSSPKDDPQGPENGSRHVLRGGSWQNDDYALLSADRSSSEPGFRGNGSQGFRLVFPAR